MKIIKSVAKEGISYTDNGNDYFINFEECNENWLEYRKRKECLNDVQLLEIKKNDRNVGRRDICAKPAFIEFFTRPFTKFEFNQLPKELENKNDFSWLQKEIIAAGRTTMDLS